MYDGYKPSHLSLNSPEINKLAYSPQMNAHIDQIKKERRDKVAFSNRENMQVGKEAADMMRAKAVERVTVGGTWGIQIIKMKPSFCCMCNVRAYTSHLIDGKVYCDYHRAHSKMPNIERRRQHLIQDPALPDYRRKKTRLDQGACANRQTKGACHGS